MANDTTGRLIGYARVSTREQNLEAQTDALRRAGVAEADIHVDKSSGARPDRVGLRNCLRDVREGDTLVVWKLDRLGRRASHIHQIAEAVQQKRADMMFLTQHVDTRTPGGKLMFALLAAFAEFERDLGIERTRLGQQKAREKGNHPGRPPQTSDANVLRMAAAVERGEKLRDVAKKFGYKSPTGVQKAIARVTGKQIGAKNAKRRK